VIIIVILTEFTVIYHCHLTSTFMISHNHTSSCGIWNDMQQSFTTDYSTTFCKAKIYVMCTDKLQRSLSQLLVWIFVDTFVN